MFQRLRKGLLGPNFGRQPQRSLLHVLDVAKRRRERDSMEQLDNLMLCGVDPSALIASSGEIDAGSGVRIPSGQQLRCDVHVFARASDDLCAAYTRQEQMT